MGEIIGAGNRILVVDMSDGSVEVHQVDRELRRMYLAAKGLGLKLLHDRMPSGADPLGPENHIAFMPGILMGTGAPCSGRYHTIAKSPLTGIFATSSCGGPFGMNLKTAGWDGLIIKGAAEAPTWLEIDSDGVSFHNASELWGLDTEEAEARLAAKRSGVMVIGPAGENLVPFANIRSGHRFTGRGGMGAVLGAKKVKAVVARGGACKIKPVHAEDFAKVKDRAAKYIESNRMTSEEYRRFGTSFNVRLNNQGNILPVNNFSDGSHPDHDRVSGQAMADRYQSKYATCKPCSILCGHKGTRDGKRIAIPEYETVGLLGSNLGIFDPDAISDFNELCGRMGMDTISVGGTIAWVMEAAEQGLINSDLRFGSADGVYRAIEDMAMRRGFGDESAMGSRWLSTKYGGVDFAIQVKGMEMAAYDPRGAFGHGLSYATANRGGCHLSAYLSAQEVYFNLLKPDSIYGKPLWVKFFEDLTCCINALQTCQFTMYAYLFESPLTRLTPDPLLMLLMQYLPGVTKHLVDYSIYKDLWNSVTGIRLGSREFLRAGERIHVLERYMNTREGVSRSDDTLPLRMLKQGRKSDPRGLTVPLGPMLDQYYELRGYDENGTPTPATLQRLEIE